MSEILNFTHAAALKAGEVAMQIRGSDSLGLQMKGERDLVTKADIECEKTIINLIRSRFPSHAILSEETNASLSDRDLNGPLWIIDPIDGTTNFAHGHPHFAVSIAYSEGGTVNVGVVHSPAQNETFSALKSSGAFLNGKRITSGTCKDLKSALVATGFPYDRQEIEPIVRRVRNVLSNCRDIRRLGACSLDIAWVACGRLDAYYENVMPWDMAAAALIAKEAGAALGHFSVPAHNALLPKDLCSTDIVVANADLLKKILEILS